MPFKSENIALPEEYDRRRKLTSRDKVEIVNRYNNGGCSYSSLAMEYGVSKRTINLIVNSDSMEKVKKRIKEHWRDYIPTKEKRNEISREHRRYKEDLRLKGILK